MNVYKGSFFYLVLRHWLATQQPPKATTQVQVVLGEAVLRRGAVAGAIQRSATVFTSVVPASWLELALHVVAGVMFVARWHFCQIDFGSV